MHLLDLPEDALLSIISCISVADLYTLLCVSRSLQYLVIPAYLRRHGIKNTTPTRIPKASFAFNNRSLQALRGLLIHTQKVPWSIGTAQFRFRLDGNPGYVTDIKRATRFLRDQVEDIQVLVVDALPLLGKYERKYPSPVQQAERSEWEEEFLQLMVLGSNRTQKRMDFTLWVQGGMAGYGGGETWHELDFPSRPVAAAKSKIKDVLTSFHRSGEKYNRALAPEEVKVSSRLPLMPKFLLCTVAILSADAVTRIELDCVLSSSEWSHFLPLIRTPNLRFLSMTSPNLELGDAEKFIVRHETTLRELELRTIDARDQLSHSKELKLPYLTSLTGRPADVAYILATATNDTLPSLHRIVIETTILMESYACVEGALWSLARWTQDSPHRVSLVLLLLASDGREDWLRRLHNSATGSPTSSSSPEDRVASAPEPRLSCVKELEISSGGVYDFTDPFMAWLPNWLGWWPSLTKISTPHRFYAHSPFTDPAQTKAATQQFVDACVEKCSTSLRMVKVGGEEFKLTER
ncbi:hypothetical protein ONZ45_g17483 [Pleurotus djamor]|nr:hypothetical protein ONZ45_g17483 [Pleurotus djamor]